MEERRAGLKVRVGAMKWHPAEGAGGEWREVAGAREDLEEGVVEVQADGFCAFTAYCQQLSEYEAQEKQLEAEIDETEEELKRGVESIQDHDELVAKKKRLEERLERTRERIRDLNARWDRMDYRYVSPGGQWDAMGGLPLFGSPHGQVMSNGGAVEPDSRRAMSQSDQCQGDASEQTACVGVDNARASSRGRGASKGKRYSYTDADKRIFTEFYLKPEEQEQKKRLGRKFYKTDALPRLMKILPHINKDKEEAVWREYLRFVEDYEKTEGHATSEDRQSLSRSSSDDNVPAPEVKRDD
jgi:cell division protein FtsB